MPNLRYSKQTGRQWTKGKNRLINEKLYRHEIVEVDGGRLVRDDRREVLKLNGRQLVRRRDRREGRVHRRANPSLCHCGARRRRDVRQGRQIRPVARQRAGTRRRVRPHGERRLRRTVPDVADPAHQSVNTNIFTQCPRRQLTCSLILAGSLDPKATAVSRLWSNPSGWSGRGATDSCLASTVPAAAEFAACFPSASRPAEDSPYSNSNLIKRAQLVIC